jgi:hypothetical protein
MTKPRFRTNGYVTFIVEPIGNFAPTNWRQTPVAYRVVECEGSSPTLGQADSWKFLHNQSAIKTNQLSRWAIHLSLKDQSLPSHVATNRSLASSNRAYESSRAENCRIDDVVCGTAMLGSPDNSHTNL